jgi:hypothetical protein
VIVDLVVVVDLDGDGDLYVVDLLVDDFTTKSPSPSPSRSTTTTTTTAFRDGN